MYVIFNMLFVLEHSHVVFYIHLGDPLLNLMSLLLLYLPSFIFFLLFCVLTIYLCTLQESLSINLGVRLCRGKGVVASCLEHGVDSWGNWSCFPVAPQ